MAEQPDFDLVILGGGPAGMAAAREVSGHGLSVVLLDEQLRPGGQVGRQPPAEFRVRHWLGGAAYRDMRAEIAAFEELADVTWLGGHSAIGLAPEADGFVVHAAGAQGALRLVARRVLIATGCYDLPVPLPGWTLPGVMTVGGVQAFIKSQQFVPGRRFVLAGTHPLMLVVAVQIVLAGGDVAMVAFDQPLAEPILALLARMGTAVRHARVLAAAADAVRLLRRHHVPIRFDRPLRAVLGEDGVSGVRWGRGADTACDRLALCYGFVPQSDLPRLAGTAMDWAAPAGGWRTRHDAWMETDRKGLFVAGETSGVAGAAVALAEGRLAGIAVLRAAGLLESRAAERCAAPVRRRLAGLRPFARLLDAVADPRHVLARAVPPETILCRCEDVSCGTITDALTQGSATNAVKLATRCGMGLCQGRSCEASLLRLIARHEDRAIETSTGFTARFPVRPVRIGDLVEPLSVAAAATKSPASRD